MRGIKPPRPHVFEPLFVKLLQLGVAFHPISSYETHPMTELPSRPIAPSKPSGTFHPDAAFDEREKR